MTRKTISSRANSVTKRYGGTTGNRKTPIKGKTTVRPKRIGGEPGVRIKKTW